jgi:O-antigen/teichoic acid export membrane protein
MWRGTLTLVAGGALAQALPLLLGPWISRLYSPAEFGHFSLVWTVATNVAVVGCARYEFALPLERDDEGAQHLLVLCARILLAVVLASTLVGWLWASLQGLGLAAWLGLAVLSGAAAQALTLWATRAEAVAALASARVLQYGGAAVLQVVFGLWAWGALGLLWAAALAALLAALMLAWAVRPLGGWRSVGWSRTPTASLADMARKHRDFPRLNAPHAFVSALQDSLALWMLATWMGDASAGFWALALRYLKAPASLVGGAVSQTLYPRLAGASSPEQARAAVRQTMAVLAALALPFMGVLLMTGPGLFAWAFGEAWRQGGELAQALAPYIALHFVAAPLAVSTMAWGAQAWALRLAVVGQVAFVAALAAGLAWGGLKGAGWAISAAMAVYFGYFFWALARWPLEKIAMHKPQRGARMGEAT